MVQNNTGLATAFLNYPFQEQLHKKIRLTAFVSQPKLQLEIYPTIVNQGNLNQLGPTSPIHCVVGLLGQDLRQESIFQESTEVGLAPLQTSCQKPGQNESSDRDIFHNRKASQCFQLFRSPCRQWKSSVQLLNVLPQAVFSLQGNTFSFVQTSMQAYGFVFGGIAPKIGCSTPSLWDVEIIFFIQPL